MNTYEQGQIDGAAGVRPQWTGTEYLRGYGPIEMGPWRAGNNGAGVRLWFAWRESVLWASQTEYHENTAGILIRYSMNGAYKKVRELNAAVEAEGEKA